MFKREMDRGENNKNWHLSIKQVVFSCSASVNAMIIMTIDICMDVLLIYMAFKASASSVIILLVYSVCQVVAPPLHGIIVRAFGKKNLLRFSMVITALATFAIFELNGVISHQYHLHWFSLGHFSTSTAALLILGAKCLLVGTTVIGKTTIAETISIETMYEASSG
ncbi:MAG: hypothetical protein KAR79_05420 [Simkaniaceae bacterium]|nr:hypothetical protein [Simkaniaceae bacterium]